MGFYDSNPLRLAVSVDAARALGGTPAGYLTADLAQMLAVETPDTVMVTTPDHTHADFIVTALEAGCDVICEKPMAVDLAQTRRITDAQARTGRKVAVTFKYRYSLARTIYGAGFGKSKTRVAVGA